MALITVDATKVAPVLIIDQWTAPVGEVCTAGQYVRADGTTGKLVLGNASSAAEVGHLKGIAYSGGSPINDTITMMKKGILDLGLSALDAFAYGEAVYLTDTDGRLGQVADVGTVSTIVGYVVPAFANGAGVPDKLLYVNL